ncbi:nucleotidyltransferase family protein [Clostridium sp. NSJ-145]|uniref:nucleotidyltransferase domain-containing protein n=1 Tax=Clostridium sp. NSJ-145 TaxID=2897777 RepID=UPI001E2C6DA6|nr:nucleotidyltransferase family protein [Clostridium sp. NSJ-145]MCD2503297.1 nucleotidyltransferase family protein [Clostridium sp. NSJ-145]
MDNTQRQIIYMLSAAIRKKNVKFKSDEKINWNEVLEESEAHKVTPLIYSSINRAEALNIMDESTLSTLKKNVFKSSITQSSHIKNVASVLERFNNAGIPIIVLKGLVVRDYYPIPDLRTMCDADVLVHEEDLEKVSALMISSGFNQIKEKDDHGAHIVFYKGSTVFEVHWTLINDRFFKGDKSFEDKLWDDAMDVTVGGVKTKSLSLEDLAVHLCTHMAVHLAYSGFGVRQLTDLVVLVEKKGHLIDWKAFLNKSKECGVYTFAIAIFNICNRLFDMEMPKEIKGEKNIKNKYIEQLIQDIFDSGVHGKKSNDRVFAAEFAFDQGEGAADGSVSIIKKFMKLLFPPISQMSDKYNYAKKFILLAPIAWIHHLIEGILNKDYNFSSKMKMATSTVSVANKRNKLLKELEL